LSEDERLRFAPDERPPAFDADAQPAPPAEHWSDIRLAKANRNYAVEYIRNGVRELVGVIGRERALELGTSAARLTGLQNWRRISTAIGTGDGGPDEAARLLAEMFRGMGDDVTITDQNDDASVILRQGGLRIVRGLSAGEREDLLACWIEIWRGVVHAHRDFMDVGVQTSVESLEWTISRSRPDPHTPVS
jgi:hypothetical protein